jgi:hypothetical protein
MSEEESDDNEKETIKENEILKVDELKLNEIGEVENLEDFKLTYSEKNSNKSHCDKSVDLVNQQKLLFQPHPRRSSYLQFHKSILYLYGGRFEDYEDRELTMNDMYCLNLKKLDEWKILHDDKDLKIEESRIKKNDFESSGINSHK